MMSNEISDDQVIIASEVIAESLLFNSSYAFVFRSDEKTRFHSMKLLFYNNLKLVLHKAKHSLYFNFCDSDENVSRRTLLSFFMLVASDAVEFSLFEMFYYGNILKIIWNDGIAVIQRLLRAKDYYDNAERELTKGRKYYSLQRMVVNKKHQGKGIGSMHLSSILKQVADRDNMPVVLATQEIRNVAFYNRLGFEIAKTVVYEAAPGDDTSYNYTTYFMIREPIAAT